jgi:L-threonylcarbamoyladenylate synthase
MHRDCFITRSQIIAVAGKLVESGDAPRAPGDRSSHYAPAAPLEIIAPDDIEAEAAAVTARHEKVGVLSMRRPLQTRRYMTWINAGRKPEVYAHNLYNHLRTLDTAGCAKIIVENIPEDERWDAIRDRLRRAAGLGRDSDNTADTATLSFLDSSG